MPDNETPMPWEIPGAPKPEMYSGVVPAERVPRLGEVLEGVPIHRRTDAPDPEEHMAGLLAAKAAEKTGHESKSVAALRARADELKRRRELGIEPDADETAARGENRRLTWLLEQARKEIRAERRDHGDTQYALYLLRCQLAEVRSLISADRRSELRRAQTQIPLLQHQVADRDAIIADLRAQLQQGDTANHVARPAIDFPEDVPAQTHSGSVYGNHPPAPWPGTDLGDGIDND